MENNFDPDKYLEFLREQTKIIREQSFDQNQVGIIWENLKITTEYWGQTARDRKVKNKNLVIEALFELNLSLQIAYSNYRKDNPGFFNSLKYFMSKNVANLDINELLKK